MSANPSRKRRSRTRHWTRRTHRVIAIVALVFLVQISITGVLLNHADAFGLTQSPAANWVVRQFYSIESPPVDAAFSVSNSTYATAGGLLFADEQLIAKQAGAIRGVVATRDYTVVATNRAFLLLTPGQALIERSDNVLGEDLARVGDADSRIIVEGLSGAFELDVDQMALREIEWPTEIRWSKTIDIDEKSRRAIETAVIGNAITWDRVTSDIHNGRIVPGIGQYLADLAAFCLLYLCMTGLFMWFRR